jgi:hypothetical protein
VGGLIAIGGYAMAVVVMFALGIAALIGKY